MKLKIEIDLANDSLATIVALWRGHHTSDTVLDVLDGVAFIGLTDDGGSVRDGNDNTVGTYEFQGSAT